MQQERTPISAMDLKVCISNMRKNARFTEDIISLVQEDLAFGLTKEETEEYTGGKFDVRQMRVYSRCLRGGYPKVTREAIMAEGLGADQMMVALEFYERGVPLETIKEVVSGREATAFTMKKLFQKVLMEMEAAGKAVEQEAPYVRELMGQVREMVAKMEGQDRRYDTILEKINGLCQAKTGPVPEEMALAQLAEKDALLIRQQEEITSLRVMAAKRRKETGEMGKKEQEMGTQAVPAVQSHEGKAAMLPGQGQEGRRGAAGRVTAYRAAIVDDDGKIVQMIPVERDRRKSGSIAPALFSRLFFHRKLDIIKLVAENNLSPGQLAQVRSAIKSGLTEQQLLVLINSDIPEDAMEEIILIAVYENEYRRLERG